MVGWYFFVFKYIYICGCIYQLPLPIYKMVFQIFYKMEVPDTGIWSCSHIKWCWVCINRSLSTKWSAPDGKKKHKIWFIGGPRPTILNGKCQRGYLCNIIVISRGNSLPTPNLWQGHHVSRGDGRFPACVAILPDIYITESKFRKKSGKVKLLIQLWFP